jgi:hypothetical protein
MLLKEVMLIKWSIQELVHRKCQLDYQLMELIHNSLVYYQSSKKTLMFIHINKTHKKGINYQ